MKPFHASGSLIFSFFRSLWVAWRAPNRQLFLIMSVSQCNTLLWPKNLSSLSFSCSSNSDASPEMQENTREWETRMFNLSTKPQSVAVIPCFRVKLTCMVRLQVKEKIRVNLNLPIKAETKAESTKVFKTVDEDRKYVIQATIVRWASSRLLPLSIWLRIMKARKTTERRWKINLLSRKWPLKSRKDLPQKFLTSRKYVELKKNTLNGWKHKRRLVLRRVLNQLAQRVWQA